MCNIITEAFQGFMLVNPAYVLLLSLDKKAALASWVILLPVARAGPAGQHPLPDLAGSQPHLHRVVPQQGLQFQHHQLHQLRPILRPWPDGVRRHGAADGRHLQHLYPQDRHREPLLRRVLRRQIRHLPRPQAVGDGHAGQSGPQRTEHPQILLWQQHRDHPHQQHPVHPPELPREPSAAGQHRSGGVHPAAAAQPHHQRLSLPRPADGGRHLRPQDDRDGQKVPEAVQPHRRRRGGPQHLV